MSSTECHFSYIFIENAKSGRWSFAIWDLQIMISFTTWPSLKNKNLHVYTTFQQSLPEIVIKEFLKRWSSATLNIRNLLLWSCGMCQSMILLIRSEFGVNKTINDRDIQLKDDFQYRNRSPLVTYEAPSMCSKLSATLAVFVLKT